MSRLPPFLEITKRVRIPAAELIVTTSRAGGPGGQHVNKTETKVRVRWNALHSPALTDADKALLERRIGSRLNEDGELAVTCEANRDQRRNLAEALERLANIVRDAIKRETPRRKTKPTRGSQRRRLEAKKRRSDIKRDRRAPGLDP